jgi:hypothetical protein
MQIRITVCLFALLLGYASRAQDTTSDTDSNYVVLDSWIGADDTVEIRGYITQGTMMGLPYGVLLVQLNVHEDYTPWRILWGRGCSEQCHTDILTQMLATQHQIILTLFTDESNVWGEVHYVTRDGTGNAGIQTVTVPYLSHDDFELTEGALYHLDKDSCLVFNGTTYPKEHANDTIYPPESHLRVRYSPAGDSLIVEPVPN